MRQRIVTENRLLQVARQGWGRGRIGCPDEGAAAASGARHSLGIGAKMRSIAHLGDDDKKLSEYESFYMNSICIISQISFKILGVS
ncbi:hypothetical protein [uncultured Cohaesibacter sp.]|uniref:hypothetical protein n=1 Tax=uncultured Cohaesibacter sp. TaxID=1002546 RepID=UPI0029C72A56|nr:hypothetical protein [uncultured Cohaesibacter sp.]